MINAYAQYLEKTVFLVTVETNHSCKYKEFNSQKRPYSESWMQSHQLSNHKMQALKTSNHKYIQQLINMTC